MNFQKYIPESLQGEERAVSPVIGVILMVAITVILAAVIGAFVLGIGDDVQSDVQAGVSVDGEGSDNVTVTWTSEGTATEIFFQGDDVDEDIGFGGDDKLENVGDSQELTPDNGQTTISVVAHNEDNNINTTIRTVDVGS